MIGFLWDWFFEIMGKENMTMPTIWISLEYFRNSFYTMYQIEWMRLHEKHDRRVHLSWGKIQKMPAMKGANVFIMN